jgi:hypothetical protein
VCIYINRHEQTIIVKIRRTEKHEQIMVKIRRTKKHKCIPLKIGHIRIQRNQKAPYISAFISTFRKSGNTIYPYIHSKEKQKHDAYNMFVIIARIFIRAC